MFILIFWSIRMSHSATTYYLLSDWLLSLAYVFVFNLSIHSNDLRQYCVRFCFSYYEWHALLFYVSTHLNRSSLVLHVILSPLWLLWTVCVYFNLSIHSNEPHQFCVSFIFLLPIVTDICFCFYSLDSFKWSSAVLDVILFSLWLLWIACVLSYLSIHSNDHRQHRMSFFFSLSLSDYCRWYVFCSNLSIYSNGP